MNIFWCLSGDNNKFLEGLLLKKENIYPITHKNYITLIRPRRVTEEGRHKLDTRHET